MKQWKKYWGIMMINKQNLINEIEKKMSESSKDYDTAAMGFDKGYFAGMETAFAQVLELIESENK